ncbi:MAG: hypothetical protein RIF41_24625, partial [Polyangiaceae bacterium]
QLRADGRFADHPITHPHPLLIAVRSEDRIVLVAPAVVWDNGREIFKPFAAHFGDSKAALILMGHPVGRGLDEAVNRGLCATVSPEPSVDELYVAIHSAFELLDARQRSEKRGVWVNRYRNENG